MKPHLQIKLFGLSIKTFHFFGVAGYFIGTLTGVSLALLLELNPFIILLMSAIGASSFYLLAYLVKWISNKETIVYYHHEVFIMILCTIVLSLLNKSALPYLDITLLGIGVFLVFGRIGCFSVGCCHGIPFRHGVRYGQIHVNDGFTWYYKDIQLLPVQLIESACVFLIVTVGIFLLLNNAPAGSFVVLYTTIYGMSRFILEYFRGDPDRPFMMGLSEGQWTTLALTCITYLMSRIGWLPSYNWHLFFLLLMLLICLITNFLFLRKPFNVFFNPLNVRHLAVALSAVENPANIFSTNDPDKVNVYTTPQGLSISCSCVKKHTKPQLYTISIKDNAKVNKEFANKIAVTICKLKNYSNQYELIERQNGIYHILFLTEASQYSSNIQ